MSAEPATVGTPLLEVSDLHVRFDLPKGGQLHAVQGVSLSMSAGERFGLVGESGCGKTTTILALMGLLPSNATISGRIELEGEDLLARGEASMRPHRWNDIAIVFQGAMNAFDPVKTVGSQLVEPMELHQLAEGAAAERRAGELLELVGIGKERASRFPHEFSGGMRQRAAIAMALACNPKVLLADEPTTALDVMVQAQILELLTSLTDELELTLVFVTHDLPVIAELCDRAAVMYAGEIVEEGPVETLYHDRRHPYTRLLFAAIPDPLSDKDVTWIPGAPPRLDREIIGCAFQPRCDVAFERCLTEHPLPIWLDEQHRAACHRNDEVRTARP